MEKFRSIEVCPKCQKERFSKLKSKDVLDNFDRKYVASSVNNRFVGDYLVITCCACGYSFLELCSDAVESG